MLTKIDGYRCPACKNTDVDLETWPYRKLFGSSYHRFYGKLHCTSCCFHSDRMRINELSDIKHIPAAEEWKPTRKEQAKASEPSRLQALIDGLELLRLRHPPSGPEATFWDQKIAELVKQAKG